MNVLVNDESLKNIADAIRAKTNSATTYKPAEMAPAIQAINVGKKSFTVVQAENETIEVMPQTVISQDGNAYTLALPAITVSITPDTYYAPGNITVNGVDQGSSAATLEVTDGMVISATAATALQTAAVTFNVPGIQLQSTYRAENKYEYNSLDVGKDTTGTYDLDKLGICISDILPFTVDIDCKNFMYVADLKLTVTQGTHTYSKTFQPAIDRLLGLQAFTVPTDSDFDRSQVFDLVIEWTGVLA